MFPNLQQQVPSCKNSFHPYVTAVACEPVYLNQMLNCENSAVWTVVGETSTMTCGNVLAPETLRIRHDLRGDHLPSETTLSNTNRHMAVHLCICQHQSKACSTADSNKRRVKQHLRGNVITKKSLGSKRTSELRQQQRNRTLLVVNCTSHSSP